MCLCVEAVRWRARCGVLWRDLPAERFGPWHPVYARFRRWRQAGVWPRILDRGKTRRVCTGLWSTRRPYARVGRPPGQRNDSPVGQALGRRRGGFTNKLHLDCDAYGRICARALNGDQAGNYPQAPRLLRSHLRAGQAVLADRAYDADYVRVQIRLYGQLVLYL